ncbi:MAG: MFS transporter [Candidatus Neomarinimicrobiota bacterium]
MINSTSNPAVASRFTAERWLFWTCFIALVATSFGFIIRANVIGAWGAEFNLSETQKGELLGVGLWPFALSIILFSLVIDKIGYGRALVFAWVCHVASAVITILANGYWMLYLGTFILALGNGTVEAVINPVVATVYSKEKTKWLNILHAGWPGGMVLGGLLILILMPGLGWKWKVGLVLIPALMYGLMMIRAEFPVHERVKAGIPYKAMLQEAGVVGAAIVVVIMVAEIGRIFQWSLAAKSIVSLVLIIAYGSYTRNVGRSIFIFLLLIMIPLATTELGTDSWITELVTPVVKDIGIQPGWVLVYTAFLMMGLRFLAGPIVHRLKPLGLLAVSSTIATLGLIFLSKAAGILIFLAATVYGLGKAFFWPTMLGVASERFPRGGALTINAIGGVGMLSVGVIGAAFLGNIQDKAIETELEKENPALHSQVVGEEKLSVFGTYQPIDQEKVEGLRNGEREVIQRISDGAKKNALAKVAFFPAAMLVCYLILIFYFRAKGGYKAVELTPEKGESPDIRNV